MQATTTTRKYKFHAGQKCRIVSGRYAGKPGVIMFNEPIIGCDHGDEWFVEIGGRGMGHEVRECDMEPVEDVAARPVDPEPVARKPEPFPAGARIRHTLLGRTGTVQQVQDATWRIARFDGDKKSWFCSVDYLEELPGVAEPEPAAHPWAIGDRARIESRSHVHHGFDVILTNRLIGEIVKKPYWEYRTIDGFDPELGVYEENLVPVQAPEPPTLYRVEYAVIDDVTPGDPDGDGDYPPLSLVTSRRAALVPIAGAAERVKLAEVLEILHDAEDGYDDFLLGQIGGIPADPYAAGDRVSIVGGEHHGQGFYLIERDAGNSQRWWLSRRKDGDGWIGLHVDRFERDERGDA